MAQQDAEECWSQILSILRTNVKTPGSEKSFVDTFMSGTITSTLTCDESPDEPVITATESFLKLNCHIANSTNFMADGILTALSEKLEKRSDILGRDAVWTKTLESHKITKISCCSFCTILLETRYQ